MVQYSQEQKKDAVIELCNREGSTATVIDRLGVSRYSLYKWKSELLGKEVKKTMDKSHIPMKGELSPAVGNVVARDFHAEAPHMKWLTDLTEFQIPAGKVYLSPKKFILPKTYLYYRVSSFNVIIKYYGWIRKSFFIKH